jgi:hypothetical protein
MRWWKNQRKAAPAVAMKMIQRTHAKKIAAAIGPASLPLFENLP